MGKEEKNSMRKENEGWLIMESLLIYIAPPKLKILFCLFAEK
jgi:hypothetical protein